MTLNVWSRPRTKKAKTRGVSLFACGFLLGFPLVAAAKQGQAASEHSAKNETKTVSPLAREIRHQLAALPFYSVFDSITFTLDGKKVTLTGQVLRPKLKRSAVEAIKSLEGVEAVVDQIEVLPNSASDDELRRAVYRAVFETPELALYAAQTTPPIHIVVKNGNVALEGAVKSLADKNLAGMRAGGVANVSSLKNNLNVRAPQGSAEQGDVR